MFSCNFCSFSAPSYEDVKTHVLRVHKDDPGFGVECETCGHHFRSVETLRKHQYRHRLYSEKSRYQVSAATSSKSTLLDEKEEISNSDSSDCEDDFDAVLTEKTDEGETVSAPQTILQQKGAEFLVHIKEKFNTTESAVQEITKGVDSLLKIYNSCIEEELMKLGGDWIEKNKVKNSLSFFRGQSLFEGVHSRFLRDSFISQTWKGSIQPSKVILSWKIKSVDGRVSEVPNHFGYIVPFREQLQQILQCKDVLNCVDNPRISEQSCFNSAHDGSYYQTHPVILKDPKALSIILYLDDIQPADPLSSKTHHSLRTYYWTLGNIYPELRSSFQSINVLGLVKAKVAKMYGNGPFLEDFIEVTNELSSDKGIIFKINGHDRVFHGFVLLVSGDYPASSNLGGFKEGVKADHPCRQCMIHRDDLFSVFDESELVLRTADLHAKQIDLLFPHDSPTTEERDDHERMDISDEEDPSTFTELSKEYGINSKGPLLQLTYFDPSKCFPQDIMHLFLEGILSLACQLLLRSCIKKKKGKKLPLKDVNDFIESFDYGYFKKDKPSLIESKHLDTGLRQNSAQTLMLSVLIPFIVVDYCNPRELRNFIQLLLIVELCFSHRISAEEVITLRSMIKDYLEEFKRLYPDNMIPKMHFLLHLPMQILLFGPLTEQWAMRFEAFHSILKRLTKILHNMKNISFSLMSRLLSRRALEIEQCGGQLLYTGHKAQLAGELILCNSPYEECITSVFKNVSPNATLSVVQTLVIFGFSLRCGDIILTDHYFENLPVFGTVCHIYGYGTQYAVIFRVLNTVGFCVNFNAYEVELNQKNCQYSAMDVAKLLVNQQSSLVHVKVRNHDYVLKSPFKVEKLLSIKNTN